MGRGGVGLLWIRGPGARRPPSCPHSGRLGQAAGSRPRWRTRGGERALEQGRGGSPERPPGSGLREKPESPRQDPGRWVPCSPMGAELRPGSQDCKMAKGRREEARKASNLQAKHLSKGPREQSILELERMSPKRERGEGASATGETTPSVVCDF